jgi:hypothetical protein
MGMSGGASVQRNELNLNYTLSYSPPGALRAPTTQLRYYALDGTTWDVPFEFGEIPLP